MGLIIYVLCAIMIFQVNFVLCRYSNNYDCEWKWCGENWLVAGSKIIELGREVVARLVSSSRDLDGIVSMINQVWSIRWSNYMRFYVISSIHLHGIATYTIMYGGLKMEKVMQ